MIAKEEEEEKKKQKSIQTQQQSKDNKKKKMAYILIIIHCNDCGSGEFKLHFSCVWRHNLKKKKNKN